MLKTKLILSSLIASLFLLTACSKKQEAPNTLEGKKKELELLKTQKNDIESKISAIEKEIILMGGAAQNIVPVEALAIEEQTFERFIDIRGNVESNKAANISCKTPGQIEQINVSPGMSVAKGALLMQIDDENIRKALDEVQTQYDFAKTVYEKQKRLWDQKAGSEIQYLQAKNNLDALTKKIESIKTQIKDSKVYAPFAGFIDEVSPKLGEIVSPGYPLIKLTAMSDVKVVAQVSEAYIASVSNGDDAIVTFPEIGDTIKAKVNVVTKVIDPQNRSFKVEIKLPKIPQGLRPNLVCGVSINDETRKKALVVPLSAIQKQDNKEFVYVVGEENGLKAKRRNVKLGISNKDNVEILEGLKPGDKVIVKGVLEVSDGQAISLK